MTNEKLNRETLYALLDAASDAVLAASDEEILREAKQEHADPKSRVAQLRALADSNIILARKHRLALARKTLDMAVNRQSVVFSTGLTLAQMQARVSELLSRNFGTQNRLTLAFRNGEEMSEADIASLLEDLEALAGRERNES